VSGPDGGAVSVLAPAKINLYLGVGPLREDGFHALATVYQAVGLHDRVTVRDADDLSVTLRADPRLVVDDVPTDTSNIAVQAALLLAKHRGVERGVDIVIDKGIPVAGGMAGGSADAAAALVACDRLWGLGSPPAELLELAAELGSDVPFALVGGTALGTGRGEVVTPLVTRGDYWWVVLESDVGLSTPSVYRELDVLRRGSEVPAPRVPEELLSALRDHDVPRLGAAVGNDMEAAAVRLRPGLRDVLDAGRLDRRGAVHGALVSGSGPSCLFLCDSRADAVRVAQGLTARGLGAASVAPGPVAGAHVVPVEGA
jgi:4-diphosphocytidyl-2-C-methyl-D-erythritol kinase